jgi:glycosyltransferase involved in cell wall biosynthesis
MSKGLTVILPAKNEIFLKKTIEETLSKSRGNVEILPVLDGYDIPDEEVVKDSRVRYIKRPFKTFDLTKRQCINEAVEQASYDYVMALDAHCMLGEGYDLTILENTADNEVTILRRESLDAKNWKMYRAEGRPPVDYEYFRWQPFLAGIAGDPKGGLHGYRWDERTIERINIHREETQTMQGSMWAMRKDFFKECGLMQTEGYTGWGCESAEISLKVLLNGGKVCTEKENFYCHLHKGRAFGRMYKVPLGGIHASDQYAFNDFVNKNRKIFVDLIERFWPIPNWKHNWKNLLKEI